MDEKQKASWRRVRAKGQARYALLYGGVAWGLPAGLLLMLANFIFSLIESHFTFSFPSAYTFGRSIFTMVGFYVSGCILGWLMWNRYEREYSEPHRTQA
jgi:hypothetical protein